MLLEGITRVRILYGRYEGEVATVVKIYSSQDIDVKFKNGKYSNYDIEDVEII